MLHYSIYNDGVSSLYADRKHKVGDTDEPSLVPFISSLLIYWEVHLLLGYPNSLTPVHCAKTYQGHVG